MKILIDNLPLISAAVLHVITNIVYIIILIKTGKKDKIISLLKSEIMGLMEEAEKFLHYTGEEKRNYVFTRIKEFAIKNKINVEDTTLNNLIDTLIDFSKNVNARIKK